MKYRIAGLRAEALACDGSIKQNDSGGTHETLAIRAARRGTMTPRAMKSYAEFMYKTGTIKQLPEKWSELFFGETGELNGS